MLREEKESYKLQATSYKERVEATKKQGTRFKKILLNLAPLFLVSCSLSLAAPMPLPPAEPDPYSVRILLNPGNIFV